jgi:hypothetical protein
MAARTNQPGSPPSAPHGYGKRKKKLIKKRKDTNTVYEQTQEVGRTQKTASGYDATRGRNVGSAIATMSPDNPYDNDPMVFGGSGTEEDPYVVQDVYKALELLEGDHFIQLEQEREVSTLIAEMQNMAQEAVARGEDAPNYNLCRVSIPGTNVFCADHKGVLREHMPQLSGKPTEGSTADAYPKNDKGEVDLSDGFMANMQSLGYTITAEEWPASNLRATQSELSGSKVAGMSFAFEQGKIPRKAIYITRDGYVVDGHHRWAANLALDMRSAEDITMPVYVIDAPIMEVLDRANQYAGEMGIPQRSMDDKSGG